MFKYIKKLWYASENLNREFSELTKKLTEKYITKDQCFAIGILDNVNLNSNVSDTLITFENKNYQVSVIYSGCFTQQMNIIIEDVTPTVGNVVIPRMLNNKESCEFINVNLDNVCKCLQDISRKLDISVRERKLQHDSFRSEIQTLNEKLKSV